MSGDSIDRVFAMATLQRLWPGVQIETRSGRRTSRQHGRGTDFLVLPSSQRIRVLAPTGPRRSAAAGLSRNSSPVSRKQSAVRFVGRIGLLSGLGPLLPGGLRLEPGASERPSILDHLGDVLGEPATVVISLGTQRANRKPVLRIMDRRGRTLAFAKVGVNDLTKELVRGEARALERLGEIAWTTFTVPQVLDLSEFNGCDVLVMAAVPSGGAKGLRDSRARLALLSELSGGFGLQSDPVRGGEFMTQLRSTLAQAPDHRLVTQLSDSLAAIEEQSGSAEYSLGAWHGDFTAWNMATSKGVTHVWDWERFDARFPVGLDEVHFCLNSFVQRHGFTPHNVLVGMQHSTWRYPSSHDAQLHKATYLAALGTRYMSSLGQRGGDVAVPKAAVLVEALLQLLDD